MEKAAEELFAGGTVAVGDICNTTDSVLLKQHSPLYWHNFIEISGFVTAGAEKRFDDAVQILNDFKANQSTNQPINQTTLSPHAPYSVSKKLFELINEATENKTVTIHNREAAAENDLYKNKEGDFLSLYKNLGIDIGSFNATGKSSFQSWLPYFTKGQKIISVHNTFTDQADLDFSNTREKNEVLFFCLCPNANLFIENRLPDIDMLVSNNCRIIIGTDSYASNNQLNMYEEIKTIQQYFPQISLATLLQWATLNGAMALGIDDVYGSFEKGKRPGVVLIGDGFAKRI
ncbi:MAG: amidohydrolase family protein [Ferruginibacter sp.]